MSPHMYGACRSDREPDLCSACDLIDAHIALAAKDAEIETLKRQRDDWMKVSHAWEDDVTKLREENEALKLQIDEAWKQARELGREHGISAGNLGALICGIGDKFAEENEALKRERDGLLDWSIESMGAQRYRDLLATIAEQAKLIEQARKVFGIIPRELMQVVGPPYQMKFTPDGFRVFCDAARALEAGEGTNVPATLPL